MAGFTLEIVLRDVLLPFEISSFISVARCTLRFEQVRGNELTLSQVQKRVK